MLIIDNEGSKQKFADFISWQRFYDLPPYAIHSLQQYYSNIQELGTEIIQHDTNVVQNLLENCTASDEEVEAVIVALRDLRQYLQYDSQPSVPPSSHYHDLADNEGEEDFIEIDDTIHEENDQFLENGGKNGRKEEETFLELEHEEETLSSSPSSLSSLMANAGDFLFKDEQEEEEGYFEETAMDVEGEVDDWRYEAEEECSNNSDEESTLTDPQSLPENEESDNVENESEDSGWKFERRDESQTLFSETNADEVTLFSTSLSSHHHPPPSSFLSQEISVWISELSTIETSFSAERMQQAFLKNSIISVSQLMQLVCECLQSQQPPDGHQALIEPANFLNEMISHLKAIPRRKVFDYLCKTSNLYFQYQQSNTTVTGSYYSSQQSVVTSDSMTIILDNDIDGDDDDEKGVAFERERILCETEEKLSLEEIQEQLQIENDILQDLIEIEAMGKEQRDRWYSAKAYQTIKKSKQSHQERCKRLKRLRQLKRKEREDQEKAVKAEIDSLTLFVEGAENINLTNRPFILEMMAEDVTNPVNIDHHTHCIKDTMKEEENSVSDSNYQVMKETTEQRNVSTSNEEEQKEEENEQRQEELNYKSKLSFAPKAKVYSLSLEYSQQSKQIIKHLLTETEECLKMSNPYERMREKAIQRERIASFHHQLIQQQRAITKKTNPSSYLSAVKSSSQTGLPNTNNNNYQTTIEWICKTCQHVNDSFSEKCVKCLMHRIFSLPRPTPPPLPAARLRTRALPGRMELQQQIVDRLNFRNHSMPSYNRSTGTTIKPKATQKRQRDQRFTIDLLHDDESERKCVKRAKGSSAMKRHPSRIVYVDLNDETSKQHAIKQTSLSLEVVRSIQWAAEADEDWNQANAMMNQRQEDLKIAK